MYCPNCGTPNDDNSSFCTSCGSALSKPNVPPMAPPLQQSQQPPPMREPAQPLTQQDAARPSKPYKTEYILGLIGSIIAIAIFQILFIGGTGKFADDGDSAAIYGSLFALSAFILGFIGVSALNKGKRNGGITLTIGGGLGFIGMFFGMWISWITIFFFPLLLIAGTLALSRRISEKRN